MTKIGLVKYPDGWFLEIVAGIHSAKIEVPVSQLSVQDLNCLDEYEKILSSGEVIEAMNVVAVNSPEAIERSSSPPKTLDLKPMDEVRAVRKQRQEVYGDFYNGHTNLGRIWGAMLSNHFGSRIEDLPPDLVTVMMAALKVSRISLPFGRLHHDNYVDAQAYICMCEEASNRLQKEKEQS